MEPIVAAPGEGETVGATRIVAAGEHLDLLESEFAAGARAAAHVHRGHTDAFYVLDGEIDFRVGDETVRVPAGTTIVAPAGSVHGFAVRGAGRCLNVHAPGGYAELVRARGRGEEVDPARYDTVGPDAATAARAFVVPPGEGERLDAQHRILRVKVVRPELDLLEYSVAPEYEGPGPHYHERHTDSFYVLEGQLEFRVGDETVRAGAGTAVVVPPGVVHAFTNAGPGRARFLNLHAPDCGFVELVRRRARGEQPDESEYDIVDVES